MNPKSWAGWVSFFGERGHRCHTVAWPGHDGEPRELRESPPEVLRTLRLHDVVEVHRQFLDRLNDKPLIVGHSVGGLITQILVNEARAHAAVALDSAPPQHIIVASWKFLKTNLPIVNPLAGDDPYVFALKDFQYAFCNTMSLEETQPVYDSFVVPLPVRPGRMAGDRRDRSRVARTLVADQPTRPHSFRTSSTRRLGRRAPCPHRRCPACCR